MRSRIALRAVRTAAAVLAMTSAHARAEIYEWVDARGRTHYTTDLHQVPPDQRPDAKAAAAERPALIRAEPGPLPAAGRDAGAASLEAPARAEDAGDRVQGRDEASWRAEHDRYTLRVAQLEEALERLEAQGADTAPPARRGDISRRNYDRYAGRHEAWQRTRRQLEGARLQLERFEEKARRAGVPPGWLR